MVRDKGGEAIEILGRIGGLSPEPSGRIDVLPHYPGNNEGPLTTLVGLYDQPTSQDRHSRHGVGEEAFQAARVDRPTVKRAHAELPFGLCWLARPTKGEDAAGRAEIVDRRERSPSIGRQVFDGRVKPHGRFGNTKHSAAAHRADGTVADADVIDLGIDLEPDCLAMTSAKVCGHGSTIAELLAPTTLSASSAELLAPTTPGSSPPWTGPPGAGPRPGRTAGRGQRLRRHRRPGRPAHPDARRR